MNDLNTKNRKYNLDASILPIRKEFNRFKAKYKRFLNADIALLDVILKYVKNQDSKKIRPILLLLSGGLCGSITNEHIKAAISIEVMHAASLVHDDIIDKASERRGVPTVNHLWDNKLSVLVGDYLLSRSLDNTVKMNSIEILKIISNVATKMSQGEILQIEAGRDLVIEEHNYLKIIQSKTSALFSACCEIGGVLNNVDDKKRSTLKKFGESLGIGFQIRDDLFEYNGKKKLIGKPKGVDIENGSITLPLLYALNNSRQKERQRIMRILKKGAENEEVKEIISFVKKSGGIEYADERALSYAAKAKKHLNIFDDSEYKEALLNFIDFTVTREK